MSGKRLKVEPLDTAHDRSLFDSGSEPLDRYLKKQATQDIRRRMTACFVALADDGHIAGYYTLAATSVRSEEHTSELQSLMRISYAVFCLKKKKKTTTTATL